MKMPKLKLNDRIEVEWVDSYTNAGWLDKEEAEKRPDLDCKTIGYYLKHDKELLWLSHSIGRKTSSARDVSVITRGTIQNITKLE